MSSEIDSEKDIRECSGTGKEAEGEVGLHSCLSGGLCQLKKEPFTIVPNWAQGARPLYHVPASH